MHSGRQQQDSSFAMLKSSSSSSSSSLRLSTEAWRPPTVRGDGECDATAAQGSQSQQVEKRTYCCQCGGSCSDELSRLESRLAAMETRLADFESLMLKSCRSASQSGDIGSNWQPESTVGTGGAGRSSDSRICIGTADNPPARLPEADAELSASPATAAPPTEAPENSQSGDGDGTALNLIFSDDTSSTTWTDLGSKPLNLVCEDRKMREERPESEPMMEQPRGDEFSVSSGTESFDIVRYATQETFVQQDRQCVDLLPGFKSKACTTTPLSPPRLHSRLLCASNSQLATVMSCAERLPSPAGQCGSTHSCWESGPPREMAGPPASVSVGGNWNPQPTVVCCRPLPMAGPAVAAAASTTAVVLPCGGDASRETATANHAVDLVLRSRVTRVRGGLDAAPATGGTCVTRAPLTFVCVNDRGCGSVGDGFDDLGTVSTCEQTTATVSRDNAQLAEDRQHQQIAKRSCRSHSDNASSASSGGNCSRLGCPLCCDLVPYAQRRIGDLARDGVRVGQCRGLASPASDKGGGGDASVCIQRSGFNKLDTVIIAGLVLKAAGLHEAEGDQAGYVRLALRRMGFECAVVIGRHFTGCVCSLDSSRLLMDVGEKSCLIFSFFQPAASFSQKSGANAK